MKYPISLVWLRRDLRLRDNVALHRACRESGSVCVAFVLNPPLLKSDRFGAPLVTVFFDALRALRADLRARDSDLALLCGAFADELGALAGRIGAAAVYYNEDYEPRAIQRDREVERTLRERGIAVHATLDHVYFGADEVTRSDGQPYRVYTPYKRQWLARQADAPREPVASLRAAAGRLLARQAIGETHPDPVPQDFGFAADPNYPTASEALARQRFSEFFELNGRAERYRTDREFPEVDGTSRLSPQLRAGTIGIRTCVHFATARRNASRADARAGIDTWISEIVWRDFYQMILKQFPRVAEAPFVTAAERVPWIEPGVEFIAWSRGRTGFPIVDAAMLQLNAFGWMHNRLRMIVASFLTKNLLIDWRLGERYFEQHLADADLAANNGGWQWAASVGTDAAPYFRIFNPVEQSRRFDPEGAFIKRMIPELLSVPVPFVHAPWTMPPLLQTSLRVRIGIDYPAPIVDYRASRERAIAAFKWALSSGRA